MKLTDFLENIGRPVAYYPSLVKVTGSVCGGIFLCQLLYWRGKQSDPDGWIYKTQAEITEETGLSRCEQETARKLLKEKGLIKEKFAGVPRKLYFYLCLDEINDEWARVQNTLKNQHNAEQQPGEDEKTLKNQHNAENQHYIMQETGIIESGKPAFNNAENQQANNTETTTENITKNISYSLSDGAVRSFPPSFSATPSRGKGGQTASFFSFPEEKPVTKKKEGQVSDGYGSLAREVLIYFAQEYENYFGNPYNINWGKEIKLFTSLLRRYEQEKIKKAIQWYFRTRDEFYFASGYSVGVFYQKFNAVLLSGQNSISEIADRLVEEQRRKRQCTLDQQA